MWKGQTCSRKCPAREAKCFKCQKVGHFSSLCHSKQVSALSDQSGQKYSDNDDNFLGAVTSDSLTQWNETIEINNKQTKFKLDTGAEVTAVSESTYNEMGQPNLQKQSKSLYGPAGTHLEVCGHFTANLSHKSTHTKQTVYVVKGLKNNLLGLPAILSLNLATRLQQIEESTAVQDNFPNLFRGLGSIGEEYEIRLKDDVKPRALSTARNVPLPLRTKVQEELERMQSLGVISPVDEPSPWCAGMVVVSKPSGDVRICVDLKPLNEGVLREFHPLPKIEDTLAQLSVAAVFSKLDANSGFWQIPLARKSKLLTTFITPFGRYYFNKLPFRISSAPELFQKRMSTILSGLKGVLCWMDDVLVFGSNQNEHDNRLKAVLQRLESAGVTLNPKKCEFSRGTLKFIGHIINKNGISADPEKIIAITEMPPPSNITELRRLMGMINQLGRFLPNRAELTHPMTALLSTKSCWSWGPDQTAAFTRVKEELTTNPRVLALYNPAAETKLSADASSYGLGGVLLQKIESTWKPVAYASRSMSKTEERYAQIEKEALAITWTCDKFSVYLLGKHFDIETDHKPLVPLLSSKPLDNLPPRILRFRLRMMKYDFSISHVPGKSLFTADTLSRVPTTNTSDDSVLQEETEAFVESIVSALPATADRLEQFRKAQTDDQILSQVINFCQAGWPNKSSLSSCVKPYWKIRDELSVCKQLLLRGDRIVVPSSLQQDILQRLHQGHQGIVKCKLRARCSVWWPEISKQIDKVIQDCQTCSQNFPNRSEPLIPTQLPERPWQKVGSDLFEIKGKSYLLVIDYFSRYVEVLQLSQTTSASVISALKSIFARHGIPDTLISDNGPQYSAKEFEDFAKSYDFSHKTSSPYHPQGNGEAERGVKTVKKLLKGSKDPHLALLSYRATPLPWCNQSPAQLLMGRRIRSNLPVSPTLLRPEWPNLQEFCSQDSSYKAKLKKQFDRRHRTRDLPLLDEDTPVFITNGRDSSAVPGRVTQRATQRSYIVATPSGTSRRNRSHLNVRPDEQNDSSIK